MTTFKSTHHTARKTIVVKLGGSTLEGLNEAFFSNFKKLQEQGYDMIITHGGGPAINRELEKQQVDSHTLNGIRVTNKDAMEIVQSTLIGKVNPKLVYELNNAGIPSIGLNGFDNFLLKAEFLDEGIYGLVGEVTKVNTDLLFTLIRNGIVPVIACVGINHEGQVLNINGDTVACSVALAVQANSLLLVTDVAGIRIDDEFQQLATPSQIERWIDEEQIYGGMIPKVRGALNVLNQGVPSVQIVNEHLIGTTIIREEQMR
ncbi:acetyl-L-glutamate 5-phosphotransferase [Ureibacillus massiliensis 4400831 = CIP 108448 = CCUG 49529]|uniref:Acetylglutamate kinase n=1 Tax=Ureibacillus massiliensis 4400831 = CIP 108448 = CCUG 49529 TaxID=1211035 RepID=A0A0A3J7I1_9BACL|nr:acetylglutamate kinase [Ureibacillus massiliensis]KGR91143.1 acetyl-L-glutamate 5-phosphotransferase [Ureibacillus massiliensis 4400831 = CIP 108448 = CCUG 49529]